MNLSSKQRKELRAKAHHLKPIILVGQHGVSEAVIAEIDLALNTHELMKVRIQGSDRDECLAEAEKLCLHTHAELIARIGKTFIIFRPQQHDS